MARFIKSKKQAIGISPDSLMLRGEIKSDTINICLIDYDSEKLDIKENKPIETLAHYAKTPSTSWLNIDGLHDESIMQSIAKYFYIDPLIISDILNPHARPKVQEYDDCIYISIKMPTYNETKKTLKTENLVIVLKDNIMLTFQERVGDMFEPVRKRIANNKKRIRSAGTDYLAFALIDIIIDHYIYIISQIGYDIECLDDDLIGNINEESFMAINLYKRENNYLRKAIKPIRELILKLNRIESDIISDNVSIHYQELQHNINLANDSVDSYREILSDQFSIFQTNMSNNLNEVLKFLTIFSVIFIPITFIAGVYGTNFEFIPELSLRYGYLYMWIIIVISAISMILYFKKKKWL